MIIPNKSVPHLVRASSALTDTYVAGTVFSTDEHNTLGMLVEYTKGTENYLEIKIESSIDGGATYGQQTTESISSGVITSDAATHRFTATGNYWVVVTPIKAGVIKISSRGNGTVTGTAKITAETSWT
jgi:hypothetical protein